MFQQAVRGWFGRLCDADFVMKVPSLWKTNRLRRTGTGAAHTWANPCLLSLNPNSSSRFFNCLGSISSPRLLQAFDHAAASRSLKLSCNVGIRCEGDTRDEVERPILRALDKPYLFRYYL